MDALKVQGVSVLVSMLPEAEAQELGIMDQAVRCSARGITYVSYPIPDFGLPEIEPFSILVTDLGTRLEAGVDIAVHCRAGIGRSGMVAACTLVALGDTALAAMAKVSAARGVSIPDTVEQGYFIAFFAQQLNSVDPLSN